MRLIDADALLQRAIPHGWSTPKWVSDIAIEDAPTIDAAPVVHGKWEWNTNNGFYYCSNCKTVSPREDQDGEYCDCPNYCPNCGAKMDGERKDDDCRKTND